MEQVIEAVKEVLDDSGLPKATRVKLEEIVTILEAPGDVRMRVNKAICELEDCFSRPPRKLTFNLRFDYIS